MDYLSILIGAVSLMVSIVVGILNYRHTNKKFKELNYPFPKLLLDYEGCTRGDTRQTCFRLRINNLHTTSHMINPEISIFFENPRGWHFWKKKRIPYTHKKCPSIAPQKGEMIRFDESGSVEAFLVSELPGQCFEATQPGSTFPLAYHLIAKRPIPFGINVRYVPSMLGSTTINFCLLYTIVPLKADPAIAGMDWEAREQGKC